MFRIRNHDPSRDLAALVDIENAINPLPMTVEDMAKQEQDRPIGEVMRKMVAEDESGRVVAHGGAQRNPWDPEGSFTVWAMVLPTARGRGIGQALVGEAIDFARANGARRLIAWAREEDPRARPFAERLGFQYERHHFESRLDITNFDESRFPGAIERVEAQGIRFTDLAAEGDTPEARRKLYELNKAAALTVPGNDGTFPPLEEFSKHVFSARWFRADGQILAVQGERYVGIGAVGFGDDGAVFNAFTGTDPEYRNRGIALALKLLGIRYARERGATYFLTGNDSMNGPMLHINREKLGFVARPGIDRMALEF
jgi:GNAT superfamily N-acetyltransferase